MQRKAIYVRRTEANSSDGLKLIGRYVSAQRKYAWTRASMHGRRALPGATPHPVTTTQSHTILPTSQPPAAAAARYPCLALLNNPRHISLSKRSRLHEASPTSRLVSSPQRPPAAPLPQTPSTTASLLPAPDPSAPPLPPPQAARAQRVRTHRQVQGTGRRRNPPHTSEFSWDRVC